MEKYNDAINTIAEERQRQIDVENHFLNIDDEYDEEELIDGAVAYLLLGKQVTSLYDWNGDRVSGNTINISNGVWPWNKESFKPNPNSRIRELVKAGAMIVAEIERLQRLQTKVKEDGSETEGSDRIS